MASIRKHITQMTPEEQGLIMKELQKVNRWRVSGHLKERLVERGGDMETIQDVLDNGHIIEFHQRDGQNRVLLRGTKEYWNSVACIVFQFSDHRVITIYWNNKNDNHRTLREEAYDENVDVITLLSNL